jgi:hypothetical protein
MHDGMKLAALPLDVTVTSLIAKLTTTDPFKQQVVI